MAVPLVWASSRAKLGRKYDLANRVDALKYAAVRGKRTRGKNHRGAVRIAAEIIMKKDYRSSSRHTTAIDCILSLPI